MWRGFRGHGAVWCALLGSAAVGVHAQPAEPAADLVVEADRLAGTVDTAPDAQRVDLQDAPAGTTLRDALDAAQGVRIIRAGGEGAAFNLSIRGLQGRRVATYLGPVRLDDPATGVLDLSEVPLGALQDAVVLRGASASTEGAMGGALLLRPRAAVVPTARASLTVGAEKLWSADTAAGGPVQWGRFSGGVTALARASTTDGKFSYTPVVGPKEAPVVLAPRDRVNNDRRRVGFTLLGAGEWTGGPALEGVMDVAHVEGGIPGFGVQPLTHARERQTRVAAGVTATLPVWRHVETRVEAAVRGAAWRFEDTRPGTRVMGALLTQAGHVQGQAVVPLFTGLWAGVGTRVGLDGATAAADAGGYTGVRPTVGGFGLLRLSLGDGAFTTEARTAVSGWMVRDDAGKPALARGAGAGGAWAGGSDAVFLRPRGVFTPELRSALKVGGGVTVHAAMVRAWRNPTLEELYRPADAPLGGNPALLPEDGLEGSVGTTAVMGPLMASASVYGARMFNVIAYVNVNAFDVRPRNIGDAWRAGGELALAMRLGDLGEVKSGVDANWSRVMASGSPIPNVPLLDWRGQLALGPPRARVLLEGTARSGTAGNMYGELPVRPAVRVNAGIGLRLLAGLSVQAMVRNVTDDRSQTDLWGVPQPGREAFVTLVTDPGSALGSTGLGGLP
jgi:hypothetical protein